MMAKLRVEVHSDGAFQYYVRAAGKYVERLDEQQKNALVDMLRTIVEIEVVES